MSKNYEFDYWQQNSVKIQLIQLNSGKSPISQQYLNDLKPPPTPFF